MFVEGSIKSISFIHCIVEGCHGAAAVACGNEGVMLLRCVSTYESGDGDARVGNIVGR